VLPGQADGAALGGVAIGVFGRASVGLRDAALALLGAAIAGGLEARR
jgi:hypothetical protein